MEMQKEEHQQAMEMKAMQAQMSLETERQEKQYALKERAVQKRIEIDNQDMLGKIELEKKNKEFTELEAANAKIRADQKAYAVAELVKAYNNLNEKLVEASAMAQMSPSALMAKAFMNIGDNANKIGTLNFTPDMLDSIAKGFKADED